MHTQSNLLACPGKEEPTLGRDAPFWWRPVRSCCNVFLLGHHQWGQPKGLTLTCGVRKASKTQSQDAYPHTVPSSSGRNKYKFCYSFPSFFLFLRLIFQLFSFFLSSLFTPVFLQTFALPPPPFNALLILTPSYPPVLLSYFFSILICHGKLHSPAILLFSFLFPESVPVLPSPLCLSQLFSVWLQGCPTPGLQGRSVKQLTPGV